VYIPFKRQLRAGAMRLVERVTLMRHPPPDVPLRRLAGHTTDAVRYASIGLAISRLRREGVEGAFAEVGVFRGHTSQVLHELAPERTLYLFDTFEGFPAQDLDGVDGRFRDTDLSELERKLGDMRNVVIRKGYFPETADGLEHEQFAFVMLDVDLYKPTAAGLKFFYPRLAPGGYLFAHDYNSPESDRAVSRAVDEFMADKPERLIEIPDRWGSIVFRKS
jgi:O-methyltransferase